MNRTNQICASFFPYAIAAVFLANPVVRESYAEKCVGTSPRICVDFIDGPDPVFLTDFDVIGDNLILIAGALDWRVWSQVSASDTTPADFGSITLNPAVNGDNFKVQLRNGTTGLAGAANVGSLNLDGTISNPNWVGYSSIRESFVNYSYITGDVNGVITLVKDTGDPPAGGEMGSFTILGNANGKITIPTLTGILQIGDGITNGDVNGGFVIDVLGGALMIYGTLPSPKIGEIGDIEVGHFKIDTVADGATLDLLNGMPLGTGQCNVTTLAGTLDLHTKDVRAPLFLGDVPGTGKVLNGGILAEVFYPAFNGDFAGTATFTSVAAGGQIYAFDSDATQDTNISGDITITGDYAGLFKVAGDFTSTASLTITGDLKASSGEDGLIWIVEEAAGDIVIKGDLIGHVHHPKSFPTNGSLTVEGNVTSSGLFKTGDNATGETHDGDLIFEGNLDGDVLIHGNMSGDVTITLDQSGDLTIDEDFSGSMTVNGDVSGDLQITGDLIGSMTVGGALANGQVGGGRILVTGESSGPIKVGKKTGQLTLIQVTGGLASGATIEINTTRGNFDAGGDIHIGGPLVPSLPAVTFDGCIRIYDDADIPPKGGSLKGDLTVVGCHDPAGEELMICIDGLIKGGVYLEQTGCTGTPATWGCASPGCP